MSQVPTAPAPGESAEPLPYDVSGAHGSSAGPTAGGGHPRYGWSPEWNGAAYGSAPYGSAPYWPYAAPPWAFPGGEYGQPVKPQRNTALIVTAVVLGVLLLIAVVLVLVFAARSAAVGDPFAMGAPATTEPTPPGELGEDTLLDQLAQRCFEGDLAACDGLFYAAEVNSDYENYASTCGGRVDPYAAYFCTDLE